MHINTHYVLLLVLIIYTMLSKISGTYNTLLLHPYSVSYSFLQELDNISQVNATADLLIEDQLLPHLNMVYFSNPVLNLSTQNIIGIRLLNLAPGIYIQYIATCTYNSWLLFFITIHPLQHHDGINMYS